MPERSRLRGTVKAMAATEGSDTAGIWLATTPANLIQRRVTLAAMAILLLAFLAAASFANVPLESNNGFVPYIQATMFFGNLITAVLLFTKFSILRSHSLLILANGYLFTALITVSHTLAFPGAFAPDGLLGAGLQTAGWLHLVWHLGFPASVIVYAWMKNREDTKYPSHASVKTAILSSIAVVTGSVFAITWGIVAADEYLPRLLLDRTTFAPLAVYTGLVTSGTCVVAFLSLWMRQHSVLDRWVMIAIFATLLEMIMLSFISARYTVGWYAVRFFGVTTSTIVLIALLTETTRLYAKLAAALRVLVSERDNKLINAQAITATIAHEIRQPLTAIAASGGAARQFLKQNPPDIDRAQSSLERVVNATHRANEVFDGLRALFGKGNQSPRLIDMNEIVLDVMRSMQDELRIHWVETKTDLSAELPLISGHEGQLREVVTNLVQNALESMRTSTNRSRVLRISTVLRDRSTIAVAIEDSGTGIESERLPDIFGAFVTTKAHGTGLGLAICRMIIERHGGQLTASSDGTSGALFQFVLPFEPPENLSPRAA
jgi:signal transduction histidine kinase